MADQIVQSRGGVIGSVTRMQTWASQITDETSTEAIDIRISRLDELFKDFRTLETNLFAFPNQVSKLEEFEEKYFNLKELLLQKKRLKSEPRETSRDTPSLQATWTELFDQQKTFFEGLNATTIQLADKTFLGQDHVKLPKVQVQKFDGEYRNWPAFQDSYVSAIHANQSLSDVNKFKLLKSLLTEGPAALIKNLTETDANYAEAWNKLKLRYDKKRKILTSYINTFLDQAPALSGKASDIRSLCDKTDEIVIGIRTMGSQAEYRDAWLMQIMLRKLDSETKQLWSREVVDKDFPTLSDFFNFMNTRCDGLDDGAEEIKMEGRLSFNRPQGFKGQQLFKAMPLNSSSYLCPCCNSSHHLCRCMKFRSYNVRTRRNLVSQTGACYNCLRLGHLVEQCPDTTNCRICNKRHHTLIHEYESVYNSNETHRQQQSSTPPNSSNMLVVLNDHQPSNQHHPTPTSNSNIIDQTSQHITTSYNGLPSLNANSCFATNARKASTPQLAVLPTALIHIYDRNGNKHFANALLDSGSQCTFVTEQLVQRLRIGRSYSSFAVNGLSDSHAARTKGQVYINVSSRYSSYDSIMIKAFILPRLLTIHPSETPRSMQGELQSLDLADPNQDSVRDIDILFGADVFFDLLKPERIVATGQTHAQLTIFGWILLAPQQEDRQPAFSLSTSINDDTIDRTLQRFWELEESPTVSEHKPEHKMCESHYSQSVKQNDSGRYTVRLPFIIPPANLGNSRSAAVRRLLSMERRFDKNPELAIQYKQFMNEYSLLGHMVEIPANEIARRDGDVFYLPHHAVLKADSTTTKLRVVFDGSCKSSSGQSLNDILAVGPQLQDDLVTIITRFRQHHIVFSADVEKMYRQVLVSPPDDDFQRIVWRSNSAEEIKTYRLKTVTYGTSCAPFLAVRTLHKIADDNDKLHPTVAKIIKQDFYVDDLLSGCDNLASAIELVNELCQVLGTSGFHLRKWKSNSSELLSTIPHDLQEPSMLKFEDDNMTIKTLGLEWNPVQDVFSFVINIPATTSHTKRSLLSEISRVFDPLGWVAPSTILMKILFQELWIRKIGWEDEMPIDITQRWEAIKCNLRMLEGIRIPRHLAITSTSQTLQLHVFGDASEKAYAAAAYLRVGDVENETKTALIITKTRVAPINQTSIPRLELCAACIVAKLVKFVLRCFPNHKFQIFAWTDSETVLAWLSHYPRRWTTFVGNRTSQILETVPRQQWHYVPSQDNPADIASRGITPELLPDCKLWWAGPSWLTRSASTWPLRNDERYETTIDERRIITATHIQVKPNELVLYYLNKYSSFEKIKRIFARLYQLRYPKDHYIDLLRKAETLIIKDVQEETFNKEIRSLKTGNIIDRKSKILSLSPFLDNNGVLRVGGRLANLDCEFSMKHPVILPKNHRLTWMIIYEAHIVNLHPGPSLLASLLKQRYWIVSSRNVIRQFTQKCIKCFRYKQQITTQLMGNLPRQRVAVARPFTTTGVDYAGPIYLRSRLGRGRIPVTKGYIALFICFATKAVHIEMVSDMTTNAFIAALRRFVSRRGIPAEIVSDNGTNFVGAKRELQDLFNAVDNCENNKLILDFFSQNMIKFSFNPASAPHFGGLWESNIKSIKHHLKRVTTNATLTFEECATLLCQIEALLNSRPLCPTSSNPEDLMVLTPGHFLIGEPLTCIPEPNLQEVPKSRLCRWQNIQQRFQGFWQRWSLEYLHTLQQRPKWRQKSTNLTVGDVVLIKEDNLSPAQWLLGRITQLHPGSDTLVRVATVKTKNGPLRRPIGKLCRLPMDGED